MPIHESMQSLVGNTPLVRLSRFAQEHGLVADLCAKMEPFNPSGSAKDRAALAMIEDAEACGVLAPGSVIIEPTSGNTGIALAWISAVKGYHCVIVMPDSMSQERRLLMRAYGAELVLTPGVQGMRGAIEKAEQLASETFGSFIPGQFENPANPAMHERTTGPEIWRSADGHVDALVAGVGTGGTLTGAGRYLKKMNPALRVVAVEPADSPVLSGGTPSPHRIQGIGAGFVPGALDPSVIDEVIAVQADDALRASQALVKLEGALCGISSGAALWAAAQVAARPELKSKRVVVVLPDTGERYLSTEGFIQD